MEKISRLWTSHKIFAVHSTWQPVNFFTTRGDSCGNKMCDEFEYSSVIQGYHIYKDIFTSTIGKTLQSYREHDNDYDSFAVAIIENNIIIGHVSQTISVSCNLFLKKGGTILCVVTGPCQYSRDLEQGGLNVPCKLVFSGSVKEDFKRKVQSLLQKVPKLECFATFTITSPSGQTQLNDTQATSSSRSSASQAIVPPIQLSVFCV